MLKAIKAGRIHLNAEGKIDPELADREWAENTGQEDRAQKKPAAAAPAAPPQSPRPPPAGPDSAGAEPGSSATLGMSLAEASAVEKVYKANLAELEYRELVGELVSAKDVADHLASLFTLCRTKLLGVPTRTRQALPHLTTADLAAIDRLVREALEELSGAVFALPTAPPEQAGG